MENGYAFVAKKYIVYRSERTRAREMNTRLMHIYDELTFADANLSDMKRDNANIDGDTAMGTMLKYGSEGAKDYYEKYILTPSQSQAHRDGDIHIHDFDFYTLTTTCCQIDILKLFKGGFSTGHGFLREPNDIQSYAALACIAIQSNQNDQHGGQSIPNFDYGLAPGVAKTYRKLYASNLWKGITLLCPEAGLALDTVKDMIKAIEKESGFYPCLDMPEGYTKLETEAFLPIIRSEELLSRIHSFACENALAETEYEIDSLTGQKRAYDSLVDYSTITLRLREVQSLTAVSEGAGFGAQLKRAAASGLGGFGSFLRGTVLFAVTIWPLLLIAAIALAVTVHLRRRKKSKNDGSDENDRPAS